jgi:hypothetical protein
MDAEQATANARDEATTPGPRKLKLSKHTIRELEQGPGVYAGTPTLFPMCTFTDYPFCLAIKEPSEGS